ncbi:MAG: hypothetical protein IPJ38_21040 [Dechloromonas sp.]|uniref:NAD(P)-binding domain-containing protein n=1 Tax=Candidatus Dechloromonas phosphorivorans TaxID=2899244 RepID=A0A935K0J8_9RHOO|nr:hypothetical protein [Candidatus Dechloromonas phosphorivorans]
MSVVWCMSALGADPKKLRQSTLASKGEGKRVAAARNSLDVTVFRPSVIFGLNDYSTAFLPACCARLPFFPLGFGHARFQPVWAAGVAVILLSVPGRSFNVGQAYDLVDPRFIPCANWLITPKELTGSKATIIPLGEGLAYLQAGLMWLHRNQ